MCVYDKHPLAGRDIQYRAPNSQSRYTPSFDENNQLIIYNNILFTIKENFFHKFFKIMRCITPGWEKKIKEC